MLASIIFTITVLLFFVFFIVSKREMLLRIFSFNAATPSNELTNQLEQTADTILRRLEDQIAHLEYLLEEADIKIDTLNKKIQQCNITTESDDILPETARQKPENNTLQALQQQLPILSTQTFTDKDEIESVFAGDFSEQSKTENQVNDIVASDKHRLILAMADEGYNVLEIAKATGMGKGEIMLLLQLNKK